MTLDLDRLPRNPDLLAELVRELADALSKEQSKNEKLEHRIAALLRQRYGAKSEKMDPNQARLFADLLADVVPGAADEVASAEPEIPAWTELPRPEGQGKHGRRPLPDDLPTYQQIIDVPEPEQCCGECRGPLRRIGEEKTRLLEFIPASAQVLELVRPKYACLDGTCPGKPVIAPLPPLPIPKGKAAPGMLAHVVTSKYVDHLPLYRQVSILRRQRVEIAESTLGDWCAATADLLAPLVDVMREEVLESKVVHTDDTPVPVQDPDLNQTRKARLWTYLGDEDHPHVVFDYTATRAREGPEAFMQGYEGYLQADAYAGYDAMYRIGKIQEVACWAHARRKFFDAKAGARLGSHTALVFIAQLYAVEKEAKGLLSEDRHRLRLEKSRPILDRFKAWLDLEQQNTLPKSPLGEAIAYALNQWSALLRYLEDGDLAIDNNAAERVLRTVAVGRKNWLFAGSDEGGRRSAILYSLTESCKRLQIDPFLYLRDVINLMPKIPADLIANFVPARWKAIREANDLPLR